VTPTVILASAVARALGVPVDPDADEARQWVLDELAKPEYREAQPTWFDLLAGAIRDWFASLSFGAAGGPPGIGALIVVLVVVVVLVIAFLVFGAPRLNRKSTVAGSLFGDDDDRDAAAIRRAAEEAARAGDYTLAVAESFRAIARGLAERTVLTTTPGTTAHDFSVRAAAAFPAFDERLADAAAVFDDVRYLGGTGDRAQYDSVAALERDLRSATPLLETIPV
jgi:hypothetical protein